MRRMGCSILKLTKRQFEVLRFVERFIARKGYSPSVREIGGAFGLCVATAYEHIKALAGKGAIRTGERKRSIEVLWSPSEQIGKVGAGKPWGGRVTVTLGELAEALDIPDEVDLVGATTGEGSLSLVLRSSEPVCGLRYLEVGSDYPQVPTGGVIGG